MKSDTFKNLQEIHDRLKILHKIHDHISTDALIQSKLLLEYLENNLGRHKFPEEVSASNGKIIFSWTKWLPKNEVDMLDVSIRGDGRVGYKSSFENLKIEYNESFILEKDLNDLFLIQIKHFI